MFFYSKKLIFFIFITSSILANENKKYYDQGHSINKSHLMQAYNDSARVNVFGKNDFFVEGDFIWLQPKEKGLRVGTKSSLVLDTISTKTLNFQTNYKIGFKAGIGMHYNFDDWTVFLLYSRLNTQNKNIFNEENFFCEWINSYIDEAEVKWNLNFNLFELELSRTNLTSKNLTFSPHFNINGGWLDQKYNINSSFHSTISSLDSWLLGPKAGIKTALLFINNFKIIFNASTALYYQRFNKIKLTFETKRIALPSIVEKYKMKTYQLTPNINLQAGIGYGSYFKKEHFHIDIILKYEFLRFWNQNYMRYLLNELNFIRFDIGSLMLHGLTTTLRWNF